jgi:hypothetical protein
MNSSDPDHQLAPTTDSLLAILRHLQQQAATDEALRGHLATIGQALCAIVETAAPVSADEQSSVEPALPHVAEDAAAKPEPLAANGLHDEGSAPADARIPASPADLDQLRRHFHGDVDEEPPSPFIPVIADDELDDQEFLASLSACCAQKSAVICRHLAASDVPLPTLLEFVALERDASNAPGVRWMLELFHKTAIAPGHWAALAGSYAATTMVSETLAQVLDDPELRNSRRAGFDLAAEVQSALRAAVATVRSQPDRSQEDLFYWLRRRTEAENYFIERHMRVQDQARPAEWTQRLERVYQWRDEVETAVYRRRHERKLFNKLRYQLRRVTEGAAEEWPRAMISIDALIANGMQPSHRGLRGLLAPHLATLRQESALSQHVQLVLRDIERAQINLAELEHSDDDAGLPEPHIDMVANLLRDRVVVMVGGDSRPPVKQTIEETFDLQELHWHDTRPHRSHMPIEAYIARPDVAVVLLAIRWASHNLGEIQTFCERYGKPLVRLPGGYNVSQIAHQILQQASDRLRTDRSEDYFDMAAGD